MPSPSIQLDIHYHVDDLNDDSARFRQAADWVGRQYGLRQLTASISIVDDATIQQLNREHLDHDWPTDVLSFVIESEQDCVDGEIVVSSETALKMYQAAGWTLPDEILLYVVHGLLHLAGLDDIQPDDQNRMRLAEQQCLLDLGVTAAEQHLQRWQSISY